MRRSSIFPSSDDTKPRDETGTKSVIVSDRRAMASAVEGRIQRVGPSRPSVARTINSVGCSSRYSRTAERGRLLRRLTFFTRIEKSVVTMRGHHNEVHRLFLGGANDLLHHISGCSNRPPRGGRKIRQIPLRHRGLLPYVEQNDLDGFRFRHTRGSLRAENRVTRVGLLIDRNEDAAKQYLPVV